MERSLILSKGYEKVEHAFSMECGCMMGKDLSPLENVFDLSMLRLMRNEIAFAKNVKDRLKTGGDLMA